MPSSLLSGKRERAEKELSHLLQINDEASSFFSGPWQDTVFDYSELEAFVPNSEQSLSIYLLPAMIFLTTNTAINVFLEEEFQNFGPEDTLFGEEFGLTTDRLPDFDELMALDTSQACKGIRYDVVRNLFNFGIKTPEDFKNYTKEDILSIKGIGKMTLQRLKDNGVIFRR